MRVLVAGGAGFIGSHLCRSLVERGDEVVCLDNLVTGRRENLTGLEGGRNFTFVEADVQAAPETAADLIIHLASPASPVHYQAHPIETMLANSTGTKRLLDISAASGARFVFASTSEVYGDPREHPQRETYWGNVNPNGPRACYDESKRFGEALTMEYCRTRGVNAGIVRIFNTYGPRMNLHDGRVVPAFIAAALAGEPLPLHGDGSQTRSFCYVSDLVAGLLHVAFDRRADGEVFNIGNPHEISMGDLAREISDLSAVACRVVHLPRGQDDPERRRPDISKIGNRYGWKPRVSLTDGLRETLGFFRQRAERPTPQPAKATP
jgi:nucleoside-diphosphate-sugar epimerase